VYWSGVETTLSYVFWPAEHEFAIKKEGRPANFEDNLKKLQKTMFFSDKSLKKKNMICLRLRLYYSYVFWPAEYESAIKNRVIQWITEITSKNRKKPRFLMVKA